jgi:NADPH-dependent curcumin reductase CurA
LEEPVSTVISPDAQSSTVLPTSTRAWRLASRPVGEPTAENIVIDTILLEPPAEGEILVANEYLSVDPYMRGRMSDKKSYIDPYPLGSHWTAPRSAG